MDFILNESQQELAALSRRVLADHATPQRLREVEAGGDRFDPALWADLAGTGILAGRIERMHRSSLILTFGGGTNEVQRDLIAAAALALPIGRR